MKVVKLIKIDKVESKHYVFLVVFIGGVAFAISSAIVPEEEAKFIKISAEIYFTSLCWISIIWILFCIIDIIRHRNKIEFTISSLNKFNSKYVNLTGDGPLSSNHRLISMTSESTRKSSNAPHIDLQLFDDYEEDHSDDNDNKKTEITSRRRSINNDNTFSIRNHCTKSTSLDNVSHCSPVSKSPVDTTRDVLSRRGALDPTEQHNLRTYVRHRRNSIVQHVIGYNYDDNSSVGGLYTRVGIGIFCLGTVIHAWLSILSNLENRSCPRWTAIMDDFSRLLFSFIQFFFIFKHSNLIIRAHESLAQLAIIHIVVTNLCVWFRMVVIETTLQIEEINGHAMTGIQHSHSIDRFHNSSENTISLLQRLLIFPWECSKLHAHHTLPLTTFINEGYMRLKPLLYPCTIEFSLMCLTLFFLIWENIGKTFTHKISDKASSKNVFMVNCHSSNKGLFGGMICLSCTMISIILYVVFRNKIHDNIPSISTSSIEMNINHFQSVLINTTTKSHRLNSTSSIVPADFTSISRIRKNIDYTIVILEIMDLCLLVLSLGVTVWAFIKIRKVSYRRTTTRFDDVLIIISLTGIYLYSIFSAFAIGSHWSASTWVAYVKVAVIILEFVEGTVHALFILIALRKRLRRTNKDAYPGRELITLLITLDLSLWLEKTTTTTKHEANPFQLDFYHVIPWSIIAAIATPLQIFFRFHASVCLAHVWTDMYNLPVYEALASPHM